MNLQDLKRLETQIQDPQELAGLRAFISLAERLPPGVTVMSKIQAPVTRRAVDSNLLANAQTIDDVRAAFGSEVTVSVENL
jgi:hypothetical protein